jgi:exopolysaccharide biosynthesis predicted pyruvyltransferase EpsI
MRLLPRDAFDHVFTPLVGKKVALIDGRGNAGDDLIHGATRQLLHEFGVDYQTVNPFWDNIEADVILIYGGGSMGSPYPHAIELRKAALETGIPCVVLPQTFRKEEDWPYQKVFVREHTSLNYRTDAIFAPDLALGYLFPDVNPAIKSSGMFLRGDESCFPRKPKTDPIWNVTRAGQYIQFASRYEHIATDRLHLAIICLGIGRKVTLLPCNYHKNLSMYNSSLKDLGCLWADHPDHVKFE